jgi:hypothetical protein
MGCKYLLELLFGVVGELCQLVQFAAAAHEDRSNVHAAISFLCSQAGSIFNAGTGANRTGAGVLTSVVVNPIGWLAVRGLRRSLC